MFVSKDDVIVMPVIMVLIVLKFWNALVITMVKFVVDLAFVTMVNVFAMKAELVLLVQSFYLVLVTALAMVKVCAYVAPVIVMLDGRVYHVINLHLVPMVAIIMVSV